jgi:hypothetical protein
MPIATEGGDTKIPNPTAEAHLTAFAPASVSSSSVPMRNPSPPIIGTPAPAPAAPIAGVRPFTRRVRARTDDSVQELIREIIKSGERQSSRMTKYDQVIQIFQDRFTLGLTSVQEMGFIAMFADSSSMVNQFHAFNEAQRDIFIQSKKLNFV